jgi:ComF family protein
MFKNLLNLFLQSNCPLCQRNTSEYFCQNCIKQLQNCQLNNPNYLWKQSLPVFIWGFYGGSVKRAIALMKYENQPQIARIFGTWLGEIWLLKPPAYDTQPIVVPIPLHTSKQKQRGYNQAALIAEGFCQITGLKLKVNALIRQKETQAQFGLLASEREKNLADAFTIGQEFRRHPPKAPVLLVDDIYTSGATAKSAIFTLNQCGISVLGLAAVATTAKG